MEESKPLKEIAKHFGKWAYCFSGQQLAEKIDTALISVFTMKTKL